MTLSEAAAQLSRAAIAMKKRREKDALARKHRKKIAAFFRRQKGLVLEEMGKQKYLFSESFQRLTEETIIDFTVQNWDRIWEDISNLSTKDLQTLIASAEADGLINGALQLKNSLPFDAKTNFNLANPRAVQWFSDNGGSLQYIKNIQDTTRDQLQVIITKAIDEGKSYTQTAKEISDKFDGFSRDRAQLIAVYETGQAYEEGNMLFSQSLKDDGIVMEKKWMTSHDDRVRPEHQANEAEGWIPIDQYHGTGDYIPPSDPGCRCYEIYEQATTQEVVFIPPVPRQPIREEIKPTPEIIIGEQGLPGIKGEKGDPGENIKGDKGDSGESIKGDKGDKGDPGESIVGPTGPPGKSIKGDKGEKGDTGKSIKGDPGKKGDEGPPGQYPDPLNLDDLSNVSITSPIENQVLQYELGRWTNKDLKPTVNVIGGGGGSGPKGDKGDPGPPLSQPPAEHYKVTNLYVNAQTGKLEVEYEIP